jgi:hypothetical protein
MFIYSNETGNHPCEGIADMRKADGFATNYAPRIVFDEEGALVGLQGGELELSKSFSLIANLKKQAAEEILRKSQQQQATLKKSFKQQKPLHRTYAQQASASRDTKHTFDGLLRELDAMKQSQNLFMKART